MIGIGSGKALSRIEMSCGDASVIVEIESECSGGRDINQRLDTAQLLPEMAGALGEVVGAAMAAEKGGAR